jgi:hypothetical protein
VVWKQRLRLVVWPLVVLVGWMAVQTATWFTISGRGAASRILPATVVGILASMLMVAAYAIPFAVRGEQRPAWGCVEWAAVPLVVAGGIVILAWTTAMGKPPGTSQLAQPVAPQLRGGDAHRDAPHYLVMLHFFHPRQDEFPGRTVWPHISIATLEKMPGGYNWFRLSRPA